MTNNLANKRYLEKNPWMPSFTAARDRCRNPKNNGYHRYGGRGIQFFLTVEEIKALWIRDGASEQEQASIDRIDNDGNYSFENCRFIEKRENSRRVARLHSKCHVYHPGVESEYVPTTDGERVCRLCRMAYSKQYRERVPQDNTKETQRAKKRAILHLDATVHKRINTGYCSGLDPTMCGAVAHPINQAYRWALITCKSCLAKRAERYKRRGGKEIK